MLAVVAEAERSGKVRASLRPVSPTVFRAHGLRFHFFSREEPRIHVHVLGQDGEAKFWLEPEITLAENHGLRAADVRAALREIEEHEHEIRAAWKHHFGG